MTKSFPLMGLELFPLSCRVYFLCLVAYIILANSSPPTWPSLTRYSRSGISRLKPNDMTIARTGYFLCTFGPFGLLLKIGFMIFLHGPAHQFPLSS